MAVRFITKRNEFFDRDYFIKAAFGILSKSFDSKSSLNYVKKIRRSWRRKNFIR